MVIDVSGSMMEEDYLPNRLEVAKTTAQNFVRLRQNDRISVVIFATTAALLCPPTFDMTAVEQFIGAIHRDIIASGSTAIGDGLALAVKHLKESEAKSRVVVLLTDGDNNAGVLSPEQAAEIAQALGIRVYTIGMTRGTARMNALGIFGNQAMSAQALGVSEEVLKDVAARTGGRYFRASSEQGLRQIYTEIDRLEKSEIEVRQTSDYDERFYLFWFPALALLGMEFLLKAFWLRRLP
jgi:Ca-activated chloride channel family protein